MKREQIRLMRTPSSKLLNLWWERMHEDPEDLYYAFTDFFPKSLLEFQNDIESGVKEFVMCIAEDDPVAAFWLHDMVYNTRGVPERGWVGGYICKPYRGSAGVHAWKLVRDYFEALGVQSIFSSIHPENRVSIVFTSHRRMMGFTLIGRFPNMTLYHGEPTDMLLLTMHEHDRDLLLQDAWMRARKQLPLLHVADMPPALVER